MLSGMPYLQMMCLVKSWANSLALIPVDVGMKLVCFVKQSTTTKIALNSPHIGKFTMKSMEIDEYGLCGIGLGIRYP